MSKFLNAMSKLGLVELEGEQAPAGAPASADDIERILQETRQLMDESEEPDPPAEPQDPPPPEEPPAVVVDENTPTTLEERSFEAIYQAAGVPEAPYPAEKMLRVLDGLRAMDTAMRKAAVMAMDAADDDWTLEDPLLDAQRKVAVLQKERTNIEAVAIAAEQQAQADLAAQDDYKTQAADTIRQQIVELEGLLEQELQKVANEKANIMRQLEETKTNCQAETARFDGEITRLGTLTSTFGTGQ